MRLLIADDDATNLRLLRAQLESEGHEVVEAPNGLLALELLRRRPVDGVISDILMPEMDGYRLCIEVRKDPELSRLPFVLYTSTYNSPADRQLATKVGADAYISKPAPTPVLLEGLRAAGSRQRITPMTMGPHAGESDILRKYSEALVRKLEDKNLELEKSLERLGIKHDVDRAIMSTSSTAQIGEVALTRLRALLGVARASVSVFDLEKQVGEWIVAVGDQLPEIAVGERYPLSRIGGLEALRTGEVQFVEVGESIPAPRRNALYRAGVRWFVVVPMVARGELIGSLNFGGASREFSAEQIGIAREVATQLAVAIQQSRLDERARWADAQYRLVFENVPLGITMSGADGAVVSANPGIAQILGYRSVDEALAALGGDASQAYARPEMRAEYVRRLREGGVVKNFELDLVRQDGTQVPVSLNGKLVIDDAGRMSQLVTIVDDISGRRAQEHRIARLSRMKQMQSSTNSAIVRNRDRKSLLEELCRIAVEQGGMRAAWVVLLDPAARKLCPVASAGRIGDFLDAVDQSIDVPDGEAPGITLGVFRSGRSVAVNDTRTADGLRYRERVIEMGFLSGMHLPLSLEGVTAGVLGLYAGEPHIFDDEERQLLDELAADVSFALESLDKSERLDFLAYYDPLTGLPNRTLFHDRLSHSLHARGGDARLIAVVLLNLERFRRVNETLGRRAGDELLCEVGGRLQKCHDSAARIGADMFGLALRGARSAAEVNRALDSILGACFTVPARVQGENLRVSCRAGVALHPVDGTDADALLRNAEAALLRSKGSGERVVFYAAEMNAQVADALALENRLRAAIEERQFVLHYQPKLALQAGRIVGAEALIRWQDPVRGLVPPGRFIPLLEETGMIVEVGRWALEQAFADVRRWVAQGLAVPRVAVNVSAIQLQRSDFVDIVIDAIDAGGDHPEWLELEITESLVMRNVEESTRKLAILRGMGVTVAIDDFGTGYSSLSYLSRLPVDALKIDRSFVSGLTARDDARALAATVVMLAHGLKLKVVAEGVETEEQAEVLRSFGCDQAQGYLYSKPVPAREFERLLRLPGLKLPAGGG